MDATQRIGRKTTLHKYLHFFVAYLNGQSPKNMIGSANTTRRAFSKLRLKYGVSSNMALAAKLDAIGIIYWDFATDTAELATEYRFTV